MTVQQAIEVLRMDGYYVYNMWHRDDVTEKFHCTDEQADEILDNVLNSESICEHIQERIFSEGDEMELELKDDYK
jgi:uncharacterized membrane protein YkoI